MSSTSKRPFCFPIKYVAVTFLFANPDGSQPPSLMTDIVADKVRTVFSVDVDPGDDPIAADFMQFETADGFHRVVLDHDAAYLTSYPPRFENWEDSAKPYVATLIDACKIANPKALVVCAVLGFYNVINLPAEVELSHYFHMLPEQPPNVVPPRHMREQNLAYSFPNRIMSGSYTTDLLYDNDPQYLHTVCEIEPTEEGTQVALDLEAHWREPFVIDEAMAAIDGMRNNLYVAFHSVISDRTRSLFQ